MKRIIAVALLCWPLLFAGCGWRTHIHPDYGKRSRAHFARQQIYATPASDNPEGLDSEEAALIHTAYRKQLGGARAEPKSSPARVLLLQESKGENKR